MSVRVFAPAKVNLSLQVGAPRADGYHPLRSFVAFADIGDWIDASPAPALSLEIRGPFAAAVADANDNLVLRAARALATMAGAGAGARLVLEKHLPVASGIGGGSSDAAATLKALNALWSLGYAESKLIEIGARLGADVPVCVAARSAWMTGVGDRISPAHAPSLAVVLVNPLKALSTAAVFREFDRAGRPSVLPEESPSAWPNAAMMLADLRRLGNDLTAPAQALMPEITQIRSVFQDDPRVRYAALSGSGATMFAVFDTLETARSAASAISQRHPAWWCCATMLGAA